MRKLFTKKNLQNNIGRIIYGFLVFTLAILVIVFSCVIDSQYSSNLIDLSVYLDNWEENAIIDLYSPQNDPQTCDNGDESIFVYYWPGTSPGCSCNDSSFTTNLCCGIDENSGSCCSGIPVQEIAPMTLYYWDLSLDLNVRNQQMICSKKLKGFNFRQNSHYNNECPSNLKTCNRDSYFVFCVPLQSKCPIQEVRFEMTENDDQSLENLQLKSQDNSYYIYFQRNQQNKLPLVDFRVSNHLSACLNEQLSFIPQQDSIFDRRSSNCTLSNQFTYTDLSLLEENYFAVHNLTVQLQQVPSFYFNVLYPFRLLSESYLMTNVDCLQYVDKFYSIDNKMRIISSAANITFIFCLIYGIYLIILESWIGFVYKKYLWGLVVLRNKVDIIWKIIYFMKFMVILTCITSSIVLAYFYNKQYDFFKNQMSESCFDDDTNQQFHNQVDNMYPGLITGIIIVIFISVFIEPNVCYIFITCYNPGKYQKIDNNSSLPTEQIDDKKGSCDQMISLPNKQNYQLNDYIVNERIQVFQQQQINNQNIILNTQIRQNQVLVLPSQAQLQQAQQEPNGIQNGLNQIQIQNNQHNEQNILQIQNNQNSNHSQNESAINTNRQLVSLNDAQAEFQSYDQNIQIEQINIEKDYQTKPGN